MPSFKQESLVKEGGSMATQVELQRVSEVNVLTQRVRKRMEELRQAEVYLSGTRSRLLTESWKETEGEPIVVRRAKGLRKLLEEAPVCIREGELIVGCQTEQIRGCFASPEWDARQFIEELKDSFTWAEDYIALEMDRREKLLILEDCDYWKGKSVVDHIENELRQLWGNKPWELFEARVWQPGYNSPPAACLVDFEKVLNRGLNGVIAEIAAKIEEESNKITDFSADALHRFDVWRSMIIACEAMICHARRYAKLARELAHQETDMARKGELERIAEICEWVPANPARSFHEALQSMWFIHMGLSFESLPQGKAPGRADQYFFPFYEQDIQQDKITRQEAAELLGCLWVKLNETQTYRRRDLREYVGSTELQNLTIGGVTEDGADATNELSFLILEVARQTKLPQPQVSLRWHDGISHEFLVKAVETTREAAGKPAFFNDKVAILGMCQQSIPLSEARDWAPQGCVERYIPHKTAPFRHYLFNFAKCFELTLNNGVDPRTGKQVGLTTGDATKFSSFDELYEAFKEQYAYLIPFGAAQWNVAQIIRGALSPFPCFGTI